MDQNGSSLAKHKQEPDSVFDSKALELEHQLMALKAKLQDKEQEITLRDEKCNEQSKKIEILQQDMATLENDLNKSYNQTLDELMKHIAGLDSCLKESKKEAEALKRSLLQAAEEKITYEAKARALEMELAAVRSLGRGGQGNKGPELESELARMKTHLQAKEQEIASYEHKCRQQAVKIGQLQEEIASMEIQLKKSYGQTVDDLVKQIDDLTKRLTESNKQVEILQNRASQADQSFRAATDQDVKQAKDLGSRLDIANKVAEFLQSSLTRSEDEKQAVAAKASELEKHLQALEAQLLEKDRQLVAKDFKLTETTRVLQFVQDGLAKSIQQNKELEMNAEHANVQVKVLETELREKDKDVVQKGFKLTETHRVLKFTQDTLVKTKHEMQEKDRVLARAVAEKEFRVTEVGRILKFTQDKLAKTAEEKKKNELALENKIVQLEFRLTESGRIVKFLESNHSKTAEEKKQNEEKARQLAVELAEVKAELRAREAEIKSGHETSLDQRAKVGDLSKQVVDLQNRLEVANRVSSFLQNSLTRVEDEMRTTKSKAQLLEEQLAALKTELFEKDKDLANKNFRLTETGRLLQFTQATLTKTQEDKKINDLSLERRIAEKEFRVTETNRVLKFVQAALTKTQEEKKQNELKLEGKIVDLEFRLTESRRVLQFVQSTLSKTAEEKKLHETKGLKLEAELKELRDELQARKAEIANGGVQAAEQAAKIEDLAQQIVELESRLLVVNRVTDFLQTSLSKAEREGEANGVKARDLEGQLNTLKAELLEKEREIVNKDFRLSETGRILKFTQSALAKTKVEQQENERNLSRQVAEKEFRATETNRVLKFVQSVLAKTQEEKKQNELKLENDICQLQFRLTESGRILRFMQSNLTRTAEEKKKLESKTQELEAELSALKTTLQAAQADIKAGNVATQEQEGKIEELTLQIGEVESRLAVTTRVAEFLQITLSRVEGEKRATEVKADELEQKLRTLMAEALEKDRDIVNKDFRLTESGRMLKFIQNLLAKTKEEKEQKDMELGRQIAEKEFKITETHRVLKFVQSALEKTKEEKKQEELKAANEIANLQFRVTELSRILKFVQASLVRATDDKKQGDAKIRELEDEMRSLKAELQEKQQAIFMANASGSEQIAKMTELEQQAKNAVSQLTVSKRMTDFYQSSLSRAEDDKQAQALKMLELEKELIACKTQCMVKDNELAELKFRLEESKGVAKFLQDKVSRLDQGAQHVDRHW